MKRIATLIAVMMTLTLATAARGAQVSEIVRVKGAEANKLVGMGLVVGLNGTGDGGKFAPAMRPLASLVQQMIDPNVVAAELKDSKNVALVTLTAMVRGSGGREGDKVDVHVACIGPAKSLQGGRLFMIPMTGPVPGSPVYAFAEGPVVIEDPQSPNVGVVREGAQLTRDIMSRYMDDRGQMTLVLHESIASWPTANNLANLINGVLAPDGPAIAMAINEKNVVVKIPEFEKKNPAGFISQILQSYVDPSQINSGAKVVINEKTGTIIISGDVQLSPVIISHKELTITTVTPALKPTDRSPQVDQNLFTALDPEKRGGPRLADLLSAFNQLKVAAPDRIAIIKELHKSGKLHAQLILE